MQPSGITLSEVVARRRRRLRRHEHDGPFFCMLLAGRYEEKAAGHALCYAAGGIAFHPAGLVHADDLAGGSRLFGIELGAGYAGRLADLGSGFGLRLEGPQSELRWLANRVRHEWARGEPCAALAIEGLVLEMLAVVARSDARRRPACPAWVDRAQEIVRAEFARPLTVVSVAAALGVEPARLARAFRRFHGRSLGAAVRRLRVEAACERLRQRDVPLTDVAAETGFADQSHLTRVFKRLTGSTPGAYRASLRG